MRNAARGKSSLTVLGLALVALQAHAVAQLSDPFAPQTRWRAAPAPTAPWMPASVDFAAGGELVFAAGAQGSPAWMLYSSPQPADSSGKVQPLCSAPATAGTLSNMSVRCGAHAGQLFALSQVPDPDNSHRRTEVARFDALATNGFAPLWIHDLSLGGNGSAKLAAAADGSRVVALVNDAQTQSLRLEWLDSASGSVLRRIDWNGGTLRQMAAASDVESVAIVAGLELWVFDSSGALRHHENLSASTQALALSGDGQSLLVGAPGLLRVLHCQSGAFIERSREIAPAFELPVRCAMSGDGLTWAAAWWNAANGRELRLELRAAANDALRWQESQSAPSSAPQNYPEVVCLSSDGRRAAFGLWGSSDAQPEVLLVDRDLGQSVARIDLPGSVLSLALDPTATRLAIGMKHSHANQFATSGEVRLFDTGERDLQLASQAVLGGTLSVCARRATARSVWFLYGPRSSTPHLLPSVQGLLWLARSSMAVVRVSADGAGTASASLPVPWSAPSAGVPFSVQALFQVRAGSSLSAAVLDPVAF